MKLSELTGRLQALCHDGYSLYEVEVRGDYPIALCIHNKETGERLCIHEFKRFVETYIPGKTSIKPIEKSDSYEGKNADETN